MKRKLCLALAALSLAGCADKPTADPMVMNAALQNVRTNVNAPFWGDKLEGIQCLVTVRRGTETPFGAPFSAIYKFNPGKTEFSLNMLQGDTQAGECQQASTGGRTCAPTLEQYKEPLNLAMDAMEKLLAARPSPNDTFILASSGQGTGADPKKVYLIRKGRLNKNEFTVDTDLSGYPITARGEDWRLDFRFSTNDHVTYSIPNSLWTVELTLPPSGK